jgi:D-glycero-D-manno-heptose 1,7-bisphosphate phosphatase
MKLSVHHRSSGVVMTSSLPSRNIDPPPGPVEWISDFGRQPSRKHIAATIFLDRDGVLVDDTGYIASPELLALLPHVADELASLQKRFRLVIVTNQSGVARGFFTEDDLQAINRRLLEMLDDAGVRIDAVYYCPHHPTAGTIGYTRVCDCRKPNPGMLTTAARNLNLTFTGSFMIGDSISDIEAGEAAGVTTILTGSKYAELPGDVKPDYVVPNLKGLRTLIELH